MHIDAYFSVAKYRKCWIEHGWYWLIFHELCRPRRYNSLIPWVQMDGCPQFPILYHHIHHVTVGCIPLFSHWTFGFVLRRITRGLFFSNIATEPPKNAKQMPKRRSEKVFPGCDRGVTFPVTFPDCPCKSSLPRCQRSSLSFFGSVSLWKFHIAMENHMFTEFTGWWLTYPFWKMMEWKSVGMMTFPRYGKS